MRVRPIFFYAGTFGEKSANDYDSTDLVVVEAASLLQGASLVDLHDGGPETVSDRISTCFFGSLFVGLFFQSPIASEAS